MALPPVGRRTMSTPNARQPSRLTTSNGWKYPRDRQAGCHWEKRSVGGVVPATTPSSRTSSTAMFHAPWAAGSSRRRQRSDIETEETDVPVLDGVVASLEAYLAAFAGCQVGARGDQVIEGDDLRLDEATLDVAVDHPGGFRRRRPLANGPGPHLRRSPRQEGHQVQQPVRRMDEGAQGGLAQPGVGQELRRLGIGQLANLRLESGRERDDLGIFGPRLLAHRLEFR